MELVPQNASFRRLRIVEDASMVLGRNAQTGIKETGLSRNVAVVKKNEQKEWVVSALKTNCVEVEHKGTIKVLDQNETRVLEDQDALYIGNNKGDLRFGYVVKREDKADKEGDNTKESCDTKDHKNFKEEKRRGVRVLPSWMQDESNDADDENTESSPNSKKSTSPAKKTASSSCSKSKIESKTTRGVKRGHDGSNDENQSGFANQSTSKSDIGLHSISDDDDDDINGNNSIEKFKTSTKRDSISSVVDKADSPRSGSKRRRRACIYGGKCYRKNPKHQRDFSHPDDSDFRDDRDECNLGVDCQSRSKRHIDKYKHTRRGSKTTKTEESDDESSDVDFSESSDEWSPKKAKKVEQESSDEESEIEGDDYEEEDDDVNDTDESSDD